MFTKPFQKNLAEKFKKLYSTAQGTFHYKDLVIEKTANLKPKPDLNEPLLFGAKSTDYSGWDKPKIVPYHNLSLAPSVSSLHYALQCFEGLKSHRNLDGKDEVYLFRPELNAARFSTSCERIALPTFDEQQFVKCLAALINVERDWVPEKEGFSLYIRPTMISTTTTLGVAAPSDAKMFIIVSPVGPYFSKGFHPVSLYASEKYVRAFPGGTGQYKVGSNYAGGIFPQKSVKEKGYDQILWLYGEQNYVTEVGTMNMFFQIINDEGNNELITAPLTDGTILPGVTRQTILELSHLWGVKSTEKQYTIDDIIKYSEEGRIIEAFGSGTAAIISPVDLIHYRGKDIKIPCGTEGSLSKKLLDYILNIQHGKIQSKYVRTVRSYL
eukprot:gene2251-2425_t